MYREQSKETLRDVAKDTQSLKSTTVLQGETDKTQERVIVPTGYRKSLFVTVRIKSSHVTSHAEYTSARLRQIVSGSSNLG